MKSLLIKDTTKEERIRIVQEALWGSCGIDCEFCSGCDNRGGGRIEAIYQPYIHCIVPGGGLNRIGQWVP